MGEKVALIVGANGISGTHLIELLLHRGTPGWSRVIGVSRKPPNARWLAAVPENVRARIGWVSVDLLKADVPEIVGKMQGAGVGVEQATHYFYMAYIDGVPDMNAANALLFERSLRAADTVAGGKLQNVLLQIGLGVYGGTASPLPWREDRCAGPNPRCNKAFYSPQMKFLREFHSIGKRWTFQITAPSVIFGVAVGAYMNFGTTLAIYAAIKAHLNEPFLFPGNSRSFTAWQDGSDAGLLAEFNLWACQEPRTHGEMLNTVNGDVWSWANIWPIFAEEFGAKIPSDQFAGVDESKPFAKRWSVEEEMTKGNKARKAWEEIVAKSPKGTVDPEAWKYATWDFVDQVVQFGSLASLSKARELGWTSYIDTENMFRQQIRRLKELGIVPPRKQPGGSTGRL